MSILSKDAILFLRKVISLNFKKNPNIIFNPRIAELPDDEMVTDVQPLQEDPNAMDDEVEKKPSTGDIVVEPKLRLPKINPTSLQRLYDKTRGSDGNVSLNCANKLFKKNKKRLRKMGIFLCSGFSSNNRSPFLERKVDNVTDLFSGLGGNAVKMEEEEDLFGCLKNDIVS